MQTQTMLASAIPAFPFFQNARPPAGPGPRIGTHPLDAIGSVLSFRSGREVYAEGDRATHWYRVTSGVLRTCKLLPDGRRQIDDFLFEGDIFGLEGASDHCFAAEAVTNAAVIGYSRSRFDAMAVEDASLSATLLQLTLKRLDKAHKRLLLLGRKTAEEKLATFLLEMLDRSEQPDAIELPMSRTDIADYLGLTIETVSRTFSLLRRDGLVALPATHTVIILNRDGLEELTGDE
jgi:CRP/FNR family transcriptional regulator, nitrogen fixation regulation protein